MYPRIKIFGTLILGSNGITVILALFYLLAKNPAALWNVFGLIFLLNLFGTMLFSQCLGHTTKKTSKRGYRVNLLCYGYLIALIVALFCIFLSIFIGFNDTIGGNLGLGLLLYGSNFGILFYGMYLGRISLLPKYQDCYSSSYTSQDSSWKLSVKAAKNLQILKKIGLTLCLVEFGFGGMVAFSILFGLIGGFQTFMIGVFAGQAGVFFGLSFLSVSLGFFRVTESHHRFQSLIKAIFLIGLIISGVCFVPLVSTPSFIQQADQDFSDRFDPVFAGDWNAQLLNSGQTEHFLPTPFSFPGYFLGSPNPACIVQKNVLYLDGTTSNYSVDAEVQLYFDAYLPPEQSTDLPGNYSTLIRIHGGGWTIGDKGLGNVITMNRYFAAQGYCVFDIQYGLNNGPENMGIPFITPDNVLGNFSLDDVMRHIGAFTFYLQDHLDEFGANLNSVFISGGSAGGQLACATALSISSGNYSDTFSEVLTIKGLIPYYPANQVSMTFAQSSKLEWINPELLVTEQSPPCLIFQGEQDHLIYRAKSFEMTYLDNANEEICVLLFPFAGHANDLYFPGYYNQVFLYYMERFMYLYH